MDLVLNVLFVNTWLVLWKSQSYYCCIAGMWCFNVHLYNEIILMLITIGNLAKKQTQEGNVIYKKKRPCSTPLCLRSFNFKFKGS